MLTDRKPRKSALLVDFLESDRSSVLDVPQDDRLQAPSTSLESVLMAGTTTPVRKACVEFLNTAADFYQVGRTPIRVLTARSLRSREGGWATELFGDYDPQTKHIRAWMMTAISKQVTSFGTFLGTLCPEFCHHFDCRPFGYLDSGHTRGFYERAAALYHDARGTLAKRLNWTMIPGGGGSTGSAPIEVTEIWS
jgi:hypothetical protein